MTSDHFQPEPNRAEPHLRLTCPVEFPDEWVTDFTAALAYPGLNIEVKRPQTIGVVTKGAWGFEWLAPTVIVAYLSKAYFDAFLKEAGKDHYNLLKSGLKKLWKCVFIHTSSPSPKALETDSIQVEPPRSLYSEMFSVVVELEAPLTLKFLIRQAISERMFAIQIDRFVEGLEQLKSGDSESTLRRLIDQARPLGAQILLTYNAYTEAFVVVDAGIAYANASQRSAPRAHLQTPLRNDPPQSAEAMLTEKVTTVVTYARSRPMFMDLLREGVLGHGREIMVRSAEFGEVTARHALIELAWMLQMIDDAENLDRLLGRDIAERHCGLELGRDGSQQPLNLRALLRKIITSKRIEWRDYATCSPVLVCIGTASDSWSEAIVDLPSLEWVCDRFSNRAKGAGREPFPEGM